MARPVPTRAERVARRQHVAGVERREDRVREELLARCRTELIEPPTPDRVTEITRSALYQAEQALLKRIADRVEPVALERLEALIVVTDDDAHAEEDVLALIKAAPGNVSLDTMLTEISKLEAIRVIGLPADLFADVAPAVVAGWRARAMVESPSHLREHPQPTKLVCASTVATGSRGTDASSIGACRRTATRRIASPRRCRARIVAAHVRPLRA